MKETFELVYRLTAQVPRGKVTTYGAIARTIGKPGAARYVGNIMAICPYSNKDVPCQRVVKSDGQVGGYGLSGVATKIRLLEKDGVKVINRKVDLKKHFFDDFKIKKFFNQQNH